MNSVRVNAPHLKDQLITKSYTGPPAGKHSLERPYQYKMYMRYGNWNVRSPYSLGLLTTVARERCTA
jgi:hypothetical protein